MGLKIMSRKNLIRISLTLAVAVMGIRAVSAQDGVVLAQDRVVLDCMPCSQKCLEEWFYSAYGGYSNCLVRCHDC